MTGRTAYIAIGANLGDRRAALHEAVRRLQDSPGMELSQYSSLREYAAVGGPADAPTYLNGVVEARTALPCDQILATLLGIERDMGRVRTRRWESRVIDLDLLLCGGETIDQPGLTIPHPRLHERRFVLEPLCELAPGLIHPLLGVPIGVLLDRLGEGGIESTNDHGRA